MTNSLETVAAIAYLTAIFIGPVVAYHLINRFGGGK